MSSDAMQVREAAPRYVAQADAQEAPSGYKRTEVGVIPADWLACSLFWLAGESKSRFDDGDWVEAEFLTDSGVRLLQTGNIGVGEFIDKEPRKYIADESFDSLRCKEVCPGDLLICRLADPAGRACIVPDLEEQRMITAVDVTIFRPIPELADSTFLLHVFGTQRWFRDVSDRCGGSTRSRIARGQLAKIKVQTPSVPEQRAIAEALSDVDGLLGALEALIAKKRAIKQAAMQQLLTGKTRLPGFSGEWETKTVGEMASVSKGVQLSANSWAPDGIVPHYNGGISPSSYTDQANTPADTIAISEGGNSCGYVQIVELPFWCGGHCYAVVPRSCDNRFLFHALKIKQPAIMGLRVGSGLPNVQKTALCAFQLRIPIDPNEQSAIATVLSDMDAEIGALEARRDKTRAIKQGMMQQLLTGQVRLVQGAGLESFSPGGE